MANPVPIDDAVELTRHIETHYHAQHRARLPQLVLLAEMIEDLHTGDEGNPHGLSGILRGLSARLDSRMKEEALILFPAIRKAAESGTGVPIAAMRADRGGHEREIALVRKITNEFTLPDAACTSWATLYAGLADFIDDLTNHLWLVKGLLPVCLMPRQSFIARSSNTMGSRRARRDGARRPFVAVPPVSPGRP